MSAREPSKNQSEDTSSASKHHETKDSESTALEYRGFAMYLGSWVFLVVWIVWAFFPDKWLHSMGIYYYPHRYWAVTIPLWVTYMVPFTMIMYICWVLVHTPHLDSYATMIDQWSNLADRAENHEDEYVPLQDIPIHLVNEKLYS